MHFPLFQISPHISKKIALWKIFLILPFPTTFFFIDHKFGISPYFPCFHISLCPLTLQNFPSDFVKFACFYILYMLFVFPYFDHDAFMHHTMHVLDVLRISVTSSLKFDNRSNPYIVIAVPPLWNKLTPEK